VLDAARPVESVLTGNIENVYSAFMIGPSSDEALEEVPRLIALPIPGHEHMCEPPRLGLHLEPTIHS